MKEFERQFSNRSNRLSFTNNNSTVHERNILSTDLHNPLDKEMLKVYLKETFNQIILE